MDKTTTVPAPAAKEHIVWLDVVRFAAMFTVVCCHCADPFNFYAGDPTADLESIKFWGAAWGAYMVCPVQPVPVDSGIARIQTGNPPYLFPVFG